MTFSVFLILISSLLIEFFSPQFSAKKYDLSKYESTLLSKPVDSIANKIVANAKEGGFVYNEGFKPTSSETAGDSSAPKISANFGSGSKPKVSVQDPYNQVFVGFTPKFRVAEPQKDKNRVIYPMVGYNGAKVYTLKPSGVKEDIILDSAPGDNAVFSYDLELPTSMEARLEEDGSIGVYGINSPLLQNNVATGSEADAQLVEKARVNGEKTKLIFKLPAPYVLEAGKKVSQSAKAWFSLEKKRLDVHVSGLERANYPLSIDPSVYVETARKLMRGNNETNADFDLDNELIQKSKTTGARINYWGASTPMGAGLWDTAATAAGGNLYRAGGRVDPTMPYVVGSQSTLQATDATSFTVNLPATRPAGDLYVLLIGHDGTATVTPPGGWTEYADTREHAAYYKIGTDQGGGNEAASYTWTLSAAEQAAAVMLRIKGFDNATPVTGTPGTGSSASAVLPIFPATTPTVDASLVIRAVGVNADQPSTSGWLPSGHSYIYSGTSSTDTANSAALLVATMDQPPAASTSTNTQTIANDGLVNDTYGASSIAIKPGTVTAGPTNTLEWATINSTTSNLDSPNPGNGVCSGWCSNSAYNLPANRIGMSLIAYNGYLYSMGGTDGTTRASTVYIAKLGANGEPQLWHPTGGTQVYWYTDTALSSERSYYAAYAYNNRMYLLGGQNNANPGGVSTAERADILPNGRLGAWTTSGNQAMPDVRHGHSIQIYNDVMYLMGGNSNGTLRNTTYYSKLNTDGTMNPWTQTNSFLTARSSFGGAMTGVWGAYIYIAGGCQVLSGSYCSTVASDVQLASINSDGSIAPWNSILNLSNQRIGQSFISWQGGLYRLGGCNRQNTTTGVCIAAHRDVEFGVINQDGDASTVNNSSPANTAPCSGATPVTCDMPAAGTGAQQSGQMSGMTVINNGYIYHMGGCSVAACTTMSPNTAYAVLNSDGTMGKPAVCTGGTYVTNSLWCVDNTHQLNGANGLGAGSATIFNNTIYVIGGTTGATNGWTSNMFSVALSSDGSLSANWTTTGTGTSGLPANFPENGANIATAGIGYGYMFARANPASAGANPGNLYYLGGCNGTNTGIGCSNYSTGVYKCSISTAGTVSGCSTNPGGSSQQLQIDSDNINTGNQGLGLMAGTIYANRLYLVGGSCTPVSSYVAATDPCANNGSNVLNSAQRKETIYAKIDNNNNIVDATTGLGSGAWKFSTAQMNPVRRRAVAFGYNGYIYSLAGYNGSASASLQDLLFAKIDVSTGDFTSFSSSGVVVTPRWDLRAIVNSGYVYAMGGCSTGAAPTCTAMQPQIQTFQLYNNDSGSPVSYNTSAGNFSAATDRWGSSTTVLNGNIYVAGGCISASDCSTATNDVQVATLSTTDGSIGTWSTSGTLPANLSWGQLEAAGGTLYYIGGQDDTGATKSSTVYYATPSGTSTTWAAATNGLPATRSKHGATVWNNRLYVIGGVTGGGAGTATNTVYVSPQLNSGGNIASAWTTSTAINVARSGGTAIAYANNLYILGGFDDTNYLNDVQFSQIANNGTVGAWSYSTSLPTRLSQADGFAYNGYMYLLGGRSTASSCIPRTLVAPISANTTIASGNNPTGIGDWYMTTQQYQGGRYGAAITYSQGKAYVLGGGCTRPQNGSYSTGTISQTANTITGAGGTVWTDNLIGSTITYQDASTATVVSVTSTTSMIVSVSKTVTAGTTYSIATPRHSYAALKAQPQVAKYSRMIDTDTDVFPTKWLLNGLDNSIGAQWNLRYRSMHDVSDGAGQQNPNEDCGTSATMPVMTTWGQETNVGAVTLGTPGTYTAKEASGGNINCARYFYMLVSIDSQQAFGYPEDITRGPTITDLTLFFTADPNKRLRHGKTFTGGEQQPLDTPF